MPTSHARGWAIARGARSTWTRFRESAAALPNHAWVVWAGTLALGLGVSVLVAFGVIWVGRPLVEGNPWDERALRDFVENGPFTFDMGIWWESLGGSAVLIPLVLLATVLAARARRPLAALSFPIAYVGVKVLIYSAWSLWNRSRPDFVADGIAAPDLHAYPSGHVVNTVGIYGLLVFLWIAKSGSWIERTLGVLVVAALGAVVGMARLALGAHWPSDVFAGAVVGAAWAAALSVALYRGERAATPQAP